MRRRPSAEVRIPSRVHPGDRVRVEVSLESSSRTPVDFIHLDLVSESVTPGGEQPLVRERLRLRAELAGATELTEGEHAYKVIFDLPADSPPSYKGSLLEIRYRLELHVSIPWWPDLSEMYELKVLPRPVPRPRRAPSASTSLRANEPFVEVSLDDVAWAPGDVIGGSFAIGNLDHAKVRGFELALVGFEEDGVLRRGPREGARYVAHLPPASIDGGREVAIRFGIPKDVPVSFTCAEARVGWVFEVRVDVKGGADVVHGVPVRVEAFDRPAEPGPMRRLVGAGRWSAVWAEVGRRHGLALGDGALELSGAIEGCDVAVRTGVRDGKGELTADLRWDPWGLGIAVTMRGLIDLGGIEVEDAPFQRRFRVKGREAAQVRAALGAPLRRALLAFDEVYLDDDHAAVRSASPGHDQPWIGAFVGNVAALTAALRRAAEQIPPPAALAGALPAWRAFATDHGGALRVGCMAVRGAVIEGARFDVETALDRDGSATGASIRLAVDPPLPRAFDLDDEATRAAVPPAARAIAATLQRDGRALRIEEGEITLATAAPIPDPAAERETMAALSALAAALRGDRGVGPYR